MSTILLNTICAHNVDSTTQYLLCTKCLQYYLIPFVHIMSTIQSDQILINVLIMSMIHSDKIDNNNVYIMSTIAFENQSNSSDSKRPKAIQSNSKRLTVTQSDSKQLNTTQCDSKQLRETQRDSKRLKDTQKHSKRL